MSAWAAATSSSGIVLWTTGRTRPSATSGHTCSTSEAQIAAFSATGRERSDVAMTAPRLRSSALMSSSVSMTGPSGVQNEPFGGTYLEIVPDRKIVYDNGFNFEKMMVVTVTFDETDGKTKLTLHTVFASDEIA